MIKPVSNWQKNIFSTSYQILTSINEFFSVCSWHFHPNHPYLFIGKYPIPPETPGPINIETDKVHKVILPPLKFTILINENMRLSNTGNSVVISATDLKKNCATVTGGPFYDSIYIYHEIRYFWCGNTSGPTGITINRQYGAPIETTSYWYNSKYDSFDNAKNYRDGMGVVTFRIMLGSKPNKLFIPLMEKMQEITLPKSSVGINHKDAFQWFDAYTENTSYFAFPSAYSDDKSKKKYYCVTTCVFPMITSISKEQYKNSFGMLKNSTDQPLMFTFAQYPSYNRPVIQAEGVIQKLQKN